MIEKQLDNRIVVSGELGYDIENGIKVDGVYLYDFIASMYGECNWEGQDDVKITIERIQEGENDRGTVR